MCQLRLNTKPNNGNYTYDLSSMNSASSEAVVKSAIEFGEIGFVPS